MIKGASHQEEIIINEYIPRVPRYMKQLTDLRGEIDAIIIMVNPPFNVNRQIDETETQ